jgi:hypothetical protein
MARTHLGLRSFMTDITIFSLSCIAVMIDFVFSRAFRDSLLGNGLPIGTLPGHYGRSVIASLRSQAAN